MKLKIEKTLSQLELKNIKSKLMQVGSELIVEIINRTQSGKDSNNNSFKPYTKPYAKAKAKEYKTTTVNLTRSNDMLNAMTPKETDFGIVIKFNSEYEATKAYYNHVVNKREFFALSDKQKSYITKQIQSLIK